MHRRRFVGKALIAGALAPLPPGASPPEEPAGEPRDVRAFGARGDGAADDAPAIQRAVDGGRGALRFPEGSYRISRTIVFPLADRGPAAIAGDGRARIIMAGPGPAFHLLGTHEKTARPSDFRSEIWERERLPLVSGLEIRGAHPEAVGIRLEGTVQATLSSLLIRRCRIGVHLARRNRNLVITHCNIHDNLETGILFDNVNLHQAIVASSHVSYNAAAGIHLLGGELRNFQIVGNDIEYNHDERREGCADVLIDLRGEGSTFREGTITGNTIQARPSPGGANIRILGGPDLRSGGLLAISGNLIGSQMTNIHLADCRGIAIAGNSLYSAHERTLLIERSANIAVGANTVDWNPDGEKKTAVDGITVRDSDGVTLSGLIVEGSFLGSAEAGGAIEVERSRDVLISACQVLDPRHRGIVLSDAVRCRVSGSTAVDRRKEPSSRASIRVAGASSDNAISGNTVNIGGLDIAAGSATTDGNIEVGPKLGPAR